MKKLSPQFGISRWRFSRRARDIFFPVFILAILNFVGFLCALAENGPPNPYQIFAEEQPNVYHISASQSSRSQGDMVPDLSQRPPALRPGALPARVRYSFTVGSAMADAATLLTDRFCGSQHEETPIFSKTLVVHPGAWMNLKPINTLGKKSATPWGFLVWDGKTNQKFSGIVLRDQDELKQVEGLIRREVQDGGGATVRALKTEEMRKWWIFIGFDIQEPTLVLETKNKKRLFVFGFVNRQIVVLDELNSLPDLQTIHQP
jgi:hypothetical protein